MLGRYVEQLMNELGDEYPFEKVHDDMQRVDAVVANLEGPITIPHEKTPNFSTHFNFDQKTAAILYQHNIRYVSLGNNHTYDYGDEGFITTQRVLAQAGIGSFGHPQNNDAEYVLDAVVGNDGKRIIFISFNFFNPAFDESQALATVAAWAERKQKNQADKNIFIATTVHGGTEYDLRSNSSQQHLYRALIDAGSNVVIAHHPHVVQEIEKYNGAYIFYSLGNFIFDQYFSKDTQQGLAIQMTLKGDEVTYDLMPVASVRSQPSFMHDAARTTFLEALAARSSVELYQDILRGQLK
jgi:poly-gamma-glutamate synthesis protein (capsule biosynthesis protein)